MGCNVKCLKRGGRFKTEQHDKNVTALLPLFFFELLSLNCLSPLFFLVWAVISVLSDPVWAHPGIVLTMYTPQILGGNSKLTAGVHLLYHIADTITES